MLFLSLADEFIAGTSNNTIEKRRCFSRMHCLKNILFICYDYICNKRKEKLPRDNFRKTMKPCKRKSVQLSPSPSGASQSGAGKTTE